MKYQSTVMMCKWNLFLLNLLTISFIIPKLISGDNLALLSGTLRTYQKAACDEEWMSLQCPVTTTISVQLAQYGRNGPTPALCQSLSSSHPDLMDNSEPNSNVSCQWPPAIQTVVGLCQKKSSCKFQTSPRTFGGDPCPGTRKYVEVAFKCRPSEFKSVIGCQDEVIQLKCNRSSRLAIYSANYGRTEYESIQCPQPSGVAEESCLASYATETVMQMCHGKRKCALGADPATFGNPCKAESRMYLKVIYTCVPRKVLKEKYQGEPDPDEIFEDEAEDEVIDSSVSGVIEQPSIYSPDHSKGWPNSIKTTLKPLQTSLNQSSEAIVSVDDGKVERDWDGHKKSSNNPDMPGLKHDSNDNDASHSSSEFNSQSGVRIIYLISQGIHAYDYVKNNPERFYLYLAISIASALFLVIVLILVKIAIFRRKQNAGGGEGVASGGGTLLSSSKPSSSSAGPILASGLSDIDELSLDLGPNDITFIELPSMLRHSSALSAAHDPQDGPSADHSCSLLGHRPLPTLGGSGGPSASPGSSMTMTPLGGIGRSNEVVRFSNTLGRKERDVNNPRSLNRDSANNLDFYYG